MIRRSSRRRLAGAGLLLLLTLAAHLTADFAWLRQNEAGPAAEAAVSTPSPLSRPAADPHGEGAVPPAAGVAAFASWVLLGPVACPCDAQAAFPPPLHPPQA